CRVAHGRRFYAKSPPLSKPARARLVARGKLSCAAPYHHHQIATLAARCAMRGALRSRWSVTRVQCSRPCECSGHAGLTRLDVPSHGIATRSLSPAFAPAAFVTGGPMVDTQVLIVGAGP